MLSFGACVFCRSWERLGSCYLPFWYIHSRSLWIWFLFKKDVYQRFYFFDLYDGFVIHSGLRVNLGASVKLVTWMWKISVQVNGYTCIVIINYICRYCLQQNVGFAFKLSLLWSDHMRQLINLTCGNWIYFSLTCPLEPVWK